MKHYTITLSDEQLNIVGAAIQELPFKVASPLLQELQKQVASQAENVEPPVSE